MKIIFNIILILLLPVCVNATDRYVHNTSSTNSLDCTNGSQTYDPTGTGSCTGGSDYVYSTVQAALNAAVVGDTIYMRGGTYTEQGAGWCNIITPTDANGTSWDTGNFTTLTSYPGEWAILDGEGTANNGCIIGQEGSTSTPGTGALNYWKFERFGVTGGTAPGESGSGNGAIRLHEGPVWLRYLYIYNNIDDSALENPSALQLYRSNSSIVEYCYFYNNGCSAAGGGNLGNCQQIEMVTDYCDELESRTCPSTVSDVYDIDDALRKNIIRYNYFDGNNLAGGLGIKYKNSQLLGPKDGSTVTYQEYGDKIHHNIFKNHSGSGINIRQDYIQVYNNIFDGDRIQSGMISSSTAGPRVRAVVYNNTLLTEVIQFNASSSTSFIPIYDYIYNNLLDNTRSDGGETRPLTWWPYAANNTSADSSKLYIDHNYLYRTDSATNHLYISPATNSGSDYGLMSISTFNTQYSTSNFYKATSEGSDNLYSSGYLTRGDHIVSETTTIANGGADIAHPYLSGVTIPAYIGATNPDDNSWVTGVLNLDADYMKDAEADSDPSWIEGAGATPNITGLKSMTGGALH